MNADQRRWDPRPREGDGEAKAVPSRLALLGVLAGLCVLLTMQFAGVWVNESVVGPNLPSIFEQPNGWSRCSHVIFLVVGPAAALGYLGLAGVAEAAVLGRFRRTGQRWAGRVVSGLLLLLLLLVTAVLAVVVLSAAD